MWVAAQSAELFGGNALSLILWGPWWGFRQAGWVGSENEACPEPGEEPPFPSFVPDPTEDISKLSFEECQLRAKAKHQYHLDFGHPTGGPPIPPA